MRVRNRHIDRNAAFAKQVVTLTADVGTDVPLGDVLIQKGTLAVSATAEDFKTTTELVFIQGGIQRNLAATDNLAFASNYTINTGTATGDFWGAFLVEATGVASPVVTAKANGADQVYASEALATAALPAVTAGSKRIGYITVQAKTDLAWTANTDDLTAASDCQAVNFYDDAEQDEETVSGVLFDSFVPGFAFEILSVQSICDAIAATSTCMVKTATRDAVSAITPAAASLAAATLSTTPANLLGTNAEAINLHATSDASGYISGLKVHVVIRPQGLRA